jgi:NAD(P)H dehydrogenase (quinone)
LLFPGAVVFLNKQESKYVPHLSEKARKQDRPLPFKKETAMTAKRTLLVAGASGHLGRRAVEHLLERAKGDRIVAGTRTPERLADLAARGVEVRALDWDKADLLPAALAGVERMLLVSTDALDRPGHRLEQHLAAISAAKRAGVRHIVYTSMPRPAEANGMMLAFDHRGTEEALRASGVAHTVLRDNWYMENLAGGISPIIASGVLSDASGDGRVGWVSREDCARAAAAALASREERSSVRDLTGPELLGLADLAVILSGFSGRPIVAKPVDGETRRRQLAAAGLPAGMVSFLVNSEEGMAQGWLAVVSDDVRALTGVPPVTFGAFLKANRRTLLPGG